MVILNFRFLAEFRPKILNLAVSRTSCFLVAASVSSMHLLGIIYESCYTYMTHRYDSWCGILKRNLMSPLDGIISPRL